MYVKKTNTGWDSNMVLPYLVKSHIVKLITDMAITKISDVKAISVKQGNEEHPEVYCETTGEPLTEGIYVREGWAGYVAVQDKDVTIQAIGTSTSVFFGTELAWNSSIMKLNREVAQALILLPQADILAHLEDAYNGIQNPKYTSIHINAE